MAYLRGDNYIWGDEYGVHFWSAKGQDGWENTGWHGSIDSVETRHLDENGNVTASGTWVPAPAVDEFVVMRFAEILEEGRFSKIAEKIVADHTDEDPIGVAEEYLDANGHWIYHPGHFVAKWKARIEKILSDEE